MRKAQPFLNLFISVTLTACSQPNEASAVIGRTQWQFDSYSCAAECDPMVDEVLRPRLGDVLNLDSPQNGFDLFSECGGTLSLKQTKMTREEVLVLLNKTVPPNQRFSENNTPLEDSILNTAQAICHENEKDSSTFWVVSLTDETMTVYFEGASFLIFKSIESN